MANADTLPHQLLNDQHAVDLVMKMMAIPGKSGDEGPIAEFIVGQLKQAGVDDASIRFDSANRKSRIGGDVGNLIVKLPGTKRGPRRLLMAHIDTVPLCVGCKPVRSGDIIRSSDPTTALGGDDRAGAAVILNTLKLLREHNLEHPPLTFLWTVQEEIGLVGARNVAIGKLGKPKLCFNWDGGVPNLAVIGATGDDHLEIEITGLASHAGAHPEMGISAIAIASRAISSLVEDGWFGLIRKGKNSGTSNIGVISGGAATNVVTDQLLLKGEVRSHDPKFRARIVKEYERAFRKAAKEIKNAEGETGSVRFEASAKYEAFRLDPKHEVVQAAEQGISQAGLKMETRISNGGLDANWMNAHGLPTVTLGCGQNQIHTVKEELHVPSFLHACRIAAAIATA